VVLPDALGPDSEQVIESPPFCAKIAACTYVGTVVLSSLSAFAQSFRAQCIEQRYRCLSGVYCNLEDPDILLDLDNTMLFRSKQAILSCMYEYEYISG